MRFGLTTLALALALTAVIAAGFSAPGHLIAIGCGIAAIGAGKVAYGRRTASGTSRLGGAAAMTIGAIGMTLGVVRVAVILAAIGHVQGML